MPDTESYLALVEHDLKLLDLITGSRPSHLASEDFSDWEVTVLYYMACIYLKAVCHLFGEDIQDHFSLRQQINTRAELLPIAKAYRHLEEASRDARYEGRRFGPSYILDRLLPKFLTVRDCAIGILERNGVSNVPHVEPGPFLERPRLNA